MKTTSRYEHKYNAFIDALYICELCDTDDFDEFYEECIMYAYTDGFNAYVNGIRVDDVTFLDNIDICDDEEVNKTIELLDMMTK